MVSEIEFERLERDITRCKKCPRLVSYIAEIRKKYPSYWCKPVPGFGDPNARVLLLGLAPGRFGSNRTGRMFTGDASGNFLYPALHKMKWANRPEASGLNDGLVLKDVYITAAARCAPPQNRPNPDEIGRCSEFLRRELALLTNLKVLVALGQIAHQTYLRLAGEKLSAHPFKHGSVHRLRRGPVLVDIYHPSRQNTQTGLLTMPMFLEVLKTAKRIAEKN